MYLRYMVPEITAPRQSTRDTAEIVGGWSSVRRVCALGSWASGGAGAFAQFRWGFIAPLWTVWLASVQVEGSEWRRLPSLGAPEVSAQIFWVVGIV